MGFTKRYLRIYCIYIMLLKEKFPINDSCKITVYAKGKKMTTEKFI